MNKTVIFLTFVFISFQSFAQHEHHQTPKDTTIKAKSPRTSAMAMIGENHIHIDYGSPSVRGRIIWNGLVAYDQVWVTGSHKATSIEFLQDVSINGKIVPKGKYAFFTIPGKTEWILILNKDWDMHLADDYNAANDVLRINVKPTQLKNPVEALQYQVIETGKNKGKIEMSWEYLRVSFDFQNTGL
ncbi:MAG TPA: DUF2911 domain-containing protein [Bacteroidia bacterium]|nr:DUF2911 domain-containing protein [Bacteroidia bacterium]